MSELLPIMPKEEKAEDIIIVKEQDQDTENQQNPEKKEKLWNLKDFKGFIHFHSWEGSSCGREMIERIIEAITKKTGLEFIAFSEHVGWMGEEYWSDKILAENLNIDIVQEKYPQLKIFKGVEVNILQDGTID